MSTGPKPKSELDILLSGGTLPSVDEAYERARRATSSIEDQLTSISGQGSEIAKALRASTDIQEQMASISGQSSAIAKALRTSTDIQDQMASISGQSSAIAKALRASSSAGDQLASLSGQRSAIAEALAEASSVLAKHDASIAKHARSSKGAAQARAATPLLDPALTNALAYPSTTLAVGAQLPSPIPPETITYSFDPLIGMSAAQILVQAAKAAEHKITVLNRELATLRAKSDAIEAEVKKLKAIVALKQGATTSDGPKEFSYEAKPDALCPSDVNGVLFRAEAPLRVNEIIEGVKQATGRDWASSTVYGHLNKAKAKGLCENSGGVWWMTEFGRRELLDL